MECLKCGRETAGADVFCGDCLSEMEKHPVPSNTPIMIHSRKEPQRKAPSRKQQKSEEVISQLLQQLHRLRVAVAVLSLLLFAALVALGYAVFTGEDIPDLGSNYSSVTYPFDSEKR